MPIGMQMSSGYRSPRPACGSIDDNNKLVSRPVVRQSKLYREKESGNAMKGIFGQENLQWNTEQQQGVFAGQGVFDAASQSVTSSHDTAVPNSGGMQSEAEYPNPGSVASCDACGEVVSRYYHCANCVEQTGLFDLCTTCCAGIYLKSGMPPRVQMPVHPTHDYGTHQMLHVAPP